METNMPLIECKSDVGITVGLIDSIITVARVLNARLDYDALICGSTGDRMQPVRDALRDLQDCSEFKRMIQFGDRDAMRVIHDAADLLRKRGS
jgi:hypothetical protein